MLQRARCKLQQAVAACGWHGILCSTLTSVGWPQSLAACLRHAPGQQAGCTACGGCCACLVIFKHVNVTCRGIRLSGNMYGSPHYWLAVQSRTHVRGVGLCIVPHARMSTINAPAEGMHACLDLINE